MTDSNDDKPTSRYTCGKCGYRWTGERTTRPVGCPRCNNYSRVGVNSPPPERARPGDTRTHVTRGANA